MGLLCLHMQLCQTLRCNFRTFTVQSCKHKAFLTSWICAKAFLVLEMCPQYMDAPAVGYLTIKLQNSTWYKCLNLSLTGSRMYVCMYVPTYTHLYRRTYILTHVPTYAPTENRKTICPRHHPVGVHKNTTSIKINSCKLSYILFKKK